MKKWTQLYEKIILRAAKIGGFILDSGKFMEVHRKQMASSDGYFEVFSDTHRSNTKCNSPISSGSKENTALTLFVPF